MNRARVVEYDLDCGGKILHLSKRTHIIGILNITPDSFSDGGLYFRQDRAIARAVEMVEEGADIIDIGGESTRPYADPVDEDEEMRRVIPVIEKLSGEISVPISIDTTKATVAEAAIRVGAQIVNDISALHFDPRMAAIVAKYRSGVILMHMKGSPKDMQNNPEYTDIIGEIVEYLNQSILTALGAGISQDKIIVDPGIGFGKKWPDNFLIINRLNEFQTLNCPLLVGVSRKSFIGKALGLPEEERIMGTAAAITASILNGVHIVRVHDIKEMAQVVNIADRIKNATETGKRRPENGDRKPETGKRKHNNLNTILIISA